MYLLLFPPHSISSLLERQAHYIKKVRKEEGGNSTKGKEKNPTFASTPQSGLVLSTLTSDPITGNDGCQLNPTTLFEPEKPISLSG